MKAILELNNAVYHLGDVLGRGVAGQVCIASRIHQKNQQQMGKIDGFDQWKTAQTLNQYDQDPQTRSRKTESPRCEEPTTREQAQNRHKILKEKQQMLKQAPEPKPQALQKSEDSSLKPELFAIKTITINSQHPASNKLYCEYQLEINILNHLKHPGIISIFDEGTTTSDFQTLELKHLHMVLEYAPGGTLLRLADLIQERDHFSCQKDKILKYYCAQLVQIVAYLQEEGISHRDIKVNNADIGQAENFVLSSDYKLKLIDFGSAHIFKDKHQELAQYIKPEPVEGEKGVKNNEERGYIGSKHYISPQLINKEREERKKSLKIRCLQTSSKDISISQANNQVSTVENLNRYSKTDIWSLGVLIYYLFTRKFPFEGINTYFIIQQIFKGEVNYDLIENEDVVMLLREMLVPDPTKRADIKTIKQSEYFKGVNFQTIFQTDSPLWTISRNQSEQYHFRGQAIVAIEGDSKRRMVGLVSKTSKQSAKEDKSYQSKVQQKKHILSNQLTTKELDIRKQTSENTTGSDKIIKSEEKLSSELLLDNRGNQKKMFLSIAKFEANAIPKQLQIVQTTIQQVDSQSCRLIGLKSVSKKVEEPKSVELKFKSEEQLQLFREAFGRMTRGKETERSTKNESIQGESSTALPPTKSPHFL